MNTYQQRIADKRERFEAHAAQAKNDSAITFNRATKLSAVIPFGQPILIGHHSEGRDRSFRARIAKTYDMAFALQHKAAHYAAKAESVGSGGISIDDPEAIAKLTTELTARTAKQDRMKAANKAIKANTGPDNRISALVAIGFLPAEAAILVKPNCVGDIGFAGYELTNNNAQIARITKRIAALTQLANRTNVERVGNGYTYKEDTEEKRVMFIFEGKPDEPTREILKREAFKWSPSRGAWVRQLNNAGLWASREVERKLKIMSVTL